MTTFSVSAWYLVDYANIVLQRIVEHGFLAHHTDLFEHHLNIFLAGTYIPADVDSRATAHSIDGLTIDNFYNVFQVIGMRHMLAVFLLVAELCARGRFRVWIWTLVQCGEQR